MAHTITVTLTNKQYDSVMATNGSPEDFYTAYVVDYANWCKRRIRERSVSTNLNTLSALSPTQLGDIVAAMPTPVIDEE